jgi:hypothetical protein
MNPSGFESRERTGRADAAVRCRIASRALGRNHPQVALPDEIWASRTDDGDLSRLEPAELEAVLRRHIELIDGVSALMDAGPLALELRDELRLLARWTIAEHRREEPLLRLLQREGDRVPELTRQVREKIVERGYRQAAVWLQRRIDAGGFPAYDTEAVTVVALGSLVAYAAQSEMLGTPPLEVDEDRFVEMWVEAWMRIANTAEEERDAAS